MSKRTLSSSPTPQATAPSPKRSKLELDPPAQAEAVASTSNQPTAKQSQNQNGNRQPKQKKRKLPAPPDFGSHADVLQKEVLRLLASRGLQLGHADGWEAPEGLQKGMEIELTVEELSSTGDSLALLPEPYPPWAAVTPFALPKEKILVRILHHGHGYSEAKLVNIIEPNSELRDESRVQCRYFGACAGCQYQMLSYDTQLDFKRRVVVRAYEHFSDLPQSSVPTVLPTIASPNQYSYRTKITPHFDAPPGQRKSRHNKNKPAQQAQTNGDAKSHTGLGERGDWELRIGFDEKGPGRKVMDIEECPIATDVINEGLKIARKNVQDTIQNYTRGATLLLRDSLVPPPGANVSKEAPPKPKTKALAPKEAEAAAIEDIGVDDGRGGTIDTTAPRLSPVDINTNPAVEAVAVAAAPVENKSAAEIANVDEKAPTIDDTDTAPMEDVAPSFPQPDASESRPAAYEGSVAGSMLDAAPAGPADKSQPSAEQADEHVCVTSPAATIYERVGTYLFSFPASAFFQNNNSVLVPLTDYVKEAIETATVGQGLPHPTHLVDTYCGSGLFSLMLSPSFETISGIDISVHSISSAVENLKLNNLPTEKFAFQTGTASAIFSSVAHFPPEQTAVVIDPPRKGCDEPFLRQLLDFRPKVVVYVSCNVHTQARDVGWLLKTQELEGRTAENGAYRIVSLRGFDLFPQTSHVESVAVLVRQ